MFALRRNNVVYLERLLNLQLKNNEIFSCKYKQTKSTSEILTSLKPFYFLVHPDLFHNNPNEMIINENSLKKLQEYLTIKQDYKQMSKREMQLKFFIRNIDTIKERNKNFKEINIQFNSDDDLSSVVEKILFECKLIPNIEMKDDKKINKFTKPKTNNDNDERGKYSSYRGNMDVFWMRDELRRREMNDIENELKRNVSDKNLVNWLNLNKEKSRQQYNSIKQTLLEINKLRYEIIDLFKLKDIYFNIDWNQRYQRGCLLSFKTIVNQHKEILPILNERYVYFTNNSGLNADGHIMLNIEDVRHNWLNVIKSIPLYDNLFNELPILKQRLSITLNGISVVRRKFELNIHIEKYILNLTKIIKCIEEYKQSNNGLPKNFPKFLHKHQIVIENDQGPLMLSPTGQFIIPSSCPAKILFDFIIENNNNAINLINNYNHIKLKEKTLIQQCINEFNLINLVKDDNIDPDLMIICCKNLIKHRALLRIYLYDINLHISAMYSLHQDGSLSIPWNFTI